MKKTIYIILLSLLVFTGCESKKEDPVVEPQVEPQEKQTEDNMIKEEVSKTEYLEITDEKLESVENGKKFTATLVNNSDEIIKIKSIRFEFYNEEGSIVASLNSMSDSVIGVREQTQITFENASLKDAVTIKHYIEELEILPKNIDVDNTKSDGQ